MRRHGLQVGWALMMLGARGAHACVVCHSVGGVRLRDALFDGSFLHRLAVVAAPVPIFAGLIALVVFAVPEMVGGQDGLREEGR